MNFKVTDLMKRNSICFTVLLLIVQNIHARPVLSFTAPESASIQDISIQVLTKAYDRLGYDIKITKLPNARSLLEANKGDYDGEVSRIANIASEYPNLRQIPTPINTINIVAYGNKKSIKINQLNEMTNGCLTVNGVKLVEKLIKANSLECSSVNTVGQALRMVNLGRASYTLLPETNARIYLSKNKLSNVGVASAALSSTTLYHYLHKKNASIIEPLNQVLLDMEANGEIKNIRLNFFEAKP